MFHYCSFPERRPNHSTPPPGLRPRKSAASGRNKSSTIADKGSFNLTAFEGEAKWLCAAKCYQVREGEGRRREKEGLCCANASLMAHSRAPSLTSSGRTQCKLRGFPGFHLEWFNHSSPLPLNGVGLKSVAPLGGTMPGCFRPNG